MGKSNGGRQRQYQGHPRRPAPQKRRTGMLLALVALGGLLVLVAGLILATKPFSREGAAQPAGGPSLVVDRESIDFGDVPLDKPVKAVFKLANAGDEPLYVMSEPKVEVKAGC